MICAMRNLFLFCCLLPPIAFAQLPESVRNQLRAAHIPEDALGASVLRLSDYSILLSHGAERSLQPASTLKLLTTIVGLEILGPAYRGRSELRTSAPVVNGVLQGDLILRGRADHDLDWNAFRNMLYTLRQKGIRDIQGDFVLDRLMFTPARRDQGAPPFDEAPEFRYNVIPDAVLLNTNLLQFDFDTDDRVLRIVTTPALDRVSIDSRMTLVERDCEKWEEGWKIPALSRSGDDVIHIQLNGEFPKNCSTSTHLNVLDRTDFADRLFRAFWRDLGGAFHGRTREALGENAEPADMRLLIEHRSRPLAEITRDINKRSDNPMTRLLYLTLGALNANPANSRTVENTEVSAERTIRSWLAQHHIDDQGLVLENGSGLSRKERIRPAQLAAILKAAGHSNWAAEFFSSLPIAALDGAMQKRLRDSPAAQRARIKTGSLKDVVAIAGYVPDANNQLCVIVAMLNHPLATGAVGRPILDALIDWVARSTANQGVTETK